MKQSFVFKNEQGDAVGFMEQENGQIHGKTKMKEKGEILLFFEDGEVYARQLHASEEEFAIEVHRNGITAACLLVGGHWVADTGGQAKARFSWYRYRKSCEKQNQQNASKAPEERKEEVDRVKSCSEAERQGQGRQHLQRRWPPPPCSPHARYEDGLWHDDSV